MNNSCSSERMRSSIPASADLFAQTSSDYPSPRPHSCSCRQEDFVFLWGQVSIVHSGNRTLPARGVPTILHFLKLKRGTNPSRANLCPWGKSSQGLLADVHLSWREQQWGHPALWIGRAGQVAFFEMPGEKWARDQGPLGGPVSGIGLMS